MTSSGETVFVNTAREIVTEALKQVAIIAIDEEPTSSEYKSCETRLNAMLKSWQTKGVTWKQETIEVTVPANTDNIELDSSIRDVNGARFLENANNDRQLGRFERDEYYRLPNKAAIGAPTVYYVDRKTTAITLYIWQVPSQDITLSLDIDRKIDTITDASQTVDIPEEWFETVFYCLAVRCAPVFGAQLRPDIFQKAAELERELFDNYRPASYFIGPDF